MESTRAFLLALSTFGVVADPTARVRPMDRVSDQVLHDGVARSPTFRRLLDRLNEGNDIVHVGSASDIDPDHDAELQLVSVSAGQRYLRISIKPMPDRGKMIVLLAHELHHAREVAIHPEVVDQPSLERLYRQLGRRRRSRPPVFETDGSVAVSERVRGELTGVNRRQTEDRSRCVP